MHMLNRGTRLRDIFLEGWRPYAWIAAAAALLYFKTLSFGYTYLDDKQLILDNIPFLSKLSNIPLIFKTRVFPDSIIPYYRPLLTLSLICDFKLGGTSLFAYHLTNIAIHVLASCLVFYTLGLLGYHKEPRFIMSTIFALHPVLAQAVAWVPGRNDSMLAVLALGSFIAFVWYLERRSPAFWFWHLVFFALALFTKESAISLVPICMIYTAVTLTGRVDTPIRKVFMIAGWAAVIIPWFLLRRIALEGALETTGYDMASSLLVSLPAVVQFIGKVFMPFNLSVYPTIRDTSFVLGITAILFMAVALAVSKNKSVPKVVFGFSWFLLFLLPALIRPHAKCVLDFQEHRLYLPVIGLFIMILEIDFVKALKFDRVRSVAAVAVVALLAAITFVHSDNFRDRFAFWDNAVKTSPNSAYIHLNTGFIRYLDKLMDEAKLEYGKALALDPQMLGTHARLGHLYLDRGLLREAMVEFEKEIALCPVFDNSYLSLGVVYYRQGRFEKAERMWKRTLELNPDNVQSNINLAIYYLNTHEPEKAEYYLRHLRDMGIEPPPDFLNKIKTK